MLPQFNLEGLWVGKWVLNSLYSLLIWCLCGLCIDAFCTGIFDIDASCL
jgi:hypothetical protein